MRTRRGLLSPDGDRIGVHRGEDQTLRRYVRGRVELRRLTSVVGMPAVRRRQRARPDLVRRRTGNVRWLDDRNGRCSADEPGPRTRARRAGPFGETMFAGGRGATTSARSVCLCIFLSHRAPSSRSPSTVRTESPPTYGSMNADGMHADPFLQTSAHAKFRPRRRPASGWRTSRTRRAQRDLRRALPHRWSPLSRHDRRRRLPGVGDGHDPDIRERNLRSRHRRACGSQMAMCGLGRRGRSLVRCSTRSFVAVGRREPDGKTLAVIAMPAVSGLLVETYRLQHLGGADRQP